MKIESSTTKQAVTIKIYQTYYLNEHQDFLDPKFHPLDVSNNPKNEHYEIEYLKSFFLSQEFLTADYLGLVSWKLADKTRLTANEIFQFVQNSPGKDLYIFSKYPHIAKQDFNVWTHGEQRHPGICALADNLFEKAALPFRTSTTGRNDIDSLSWCNFWVGNAKFWSYYGEVLIKLLKTIDHMPEDERQKYYDSTLHYGEYKTPMFPFIFERLISTILKHNPNFSHITFLQANCDILK
ncbi:hypothetical protein [Pseudomaricurvus sp. HS19]|uniref:hypothetical protein n=1 Tax=Pseudomaricurvus sp. HS19 TaxID=2692626 RepID=UPI00136D0943|nr:hypothetical protein [Pseudomaricurvus sp. HS19]MYM62863.1 hypothetical protein [Pseudomaricurvus sp. HS19]